MRNLSLLFILGLLSLVGCSTRKDGKTEDYSLKDVEEGRILAESDFNDIDLLADEGSDTMAESVPSEEVAPLLSEQEEIQVVDRSTADTSSSEFGTYTVGKNDTLMWIAFKLYGDYHKWRDIVALNSDILTRGGQSLAAGQMLKYKMPSNNFSWNPKGEPHLIQRGDTLSKISNTVYGDWKKWKKIYNNNRPMIKDPNLIFAGFTLYYLKEENFAMK